MEQNEVEIYCDNCKLPMENTKELLKAHIIAQDDNGYDVEETYFECQNCGKHYTVTVFDRETKLLVQKRTQIRNKLRTGKTISAALRKCYIDKDRELKEAIRERSEALRAKYMNE